MIPDERERVLDLVNDARRERSDRAHALREQQDGIARLREYVEAGARTVILNSACDADYVERNEAMLAEAVLPAFRA